MVKVFNSCVQAQKFLYMFPLFESLLMSLLAPCGTMGLLDEVVTSGRGDDMLVVDVD